ncbi:MFS transporter [Amycolatopsis alkalitolerans]|uniref:MFS transporter n=1 Tax=Amycolatopsis alkalitolerans TaxID=2547244 RepID=UPI00135C7A82|nr:MFS transporter [Amycolatopsis alkalitolerans]
MARDGAPHRGITLAVLCVSSGSYTLLQSALFPVLTTLQTSLHTSQANVTWVLTAYLLSASVCTPILGRLGDRWGRKRLFVVALGSLAVGSLLTALATTLPLMVVGRAGQGAGGGVLPLAFGIVHDLLPARAVAGAIGLISGISGIGAGLGIVLAGPVVDYLGYHWLFWLPLVPTAAAAIAALIVIPPSPVQTGGTLRWPAFVLLSVWLVALLLAVSEANLWGWTSVGTLGLLLASVVVFVAWVRVESRSPTPLIDMRLMKIRGVWSNNLAALLIGTCMYAPLSFAAELVQTRRSAGYGFGATLTEAGLYLAPQPTVAILLGLVNGMLTARFGSRSILLCGGVFCCASPVLLAFAHTSPWEIYLSMVCMGIGVALVFAAQSHISVSAVPPAQTGVSAGMTANIRLMGGSIGAALIGTIITAALRPDGVPAESGYRYGFLTLALIAAVGTVVATLVPRDRHGPARPPAPEAVRCTSSAAVTRGG